MCGESIIFFLDSSQEPNITHHLKVQCYNLEEYTSNSISSQEQNITHHSTAVLQLCTIPFVAAITHHSSLITRVIRCNTPIFATQFIKRFYVAAILVENIKYSAAGLYI